MPVCLNRLCYIGFHVPEGQQLASKLIHKFGFEPFATRVTEWSKQLVCRRGAAIFIVNEKLKPVAGEASPWFSSGHCKDKAFIYDVDPQYAVGTASNICFETEDVHAISQSLQERGCHILIPPTDITDKDGCVTYAVVKSILGNISHTLLDRSQYYGPFLPGFHVVKGTSKEVQEAKEVTHFDHITYACSKGNSQAVLDWYKNYFGFQRFLLHPQDNATEGYRIRGSGVGLRLTGMQFSGGGSSELGHDCKFILAESLPDQRNNQVDTFLEQHGGAGIQHVALYTTDIIRTAAGMAKSGAKFFKPPLTYFSEKSKEQEIQQVGQDPQLLKYHSILLDAEVGGEKDNSSIGPYGRPYLMQIFTKPLFSEDTFFLELIERCGAVGFGEGNIRALWQSVKNYMDQ
ncbi:4-hydroxyphenylpyruvate dioxygenase-like protein [Tiliqua scincoides]|uniref:4-hydroxyphenylpyruvate dioxygenase-like protein n=1 Tax=Tiliqua scincoides TaxID=71010 RepID=UPI0034619F91